MASIFKDTGGGILLLGLFSAICSLAQGQSAPEMKTPPLLDFGTGSGDTRVEDLISDTVVTLPYNISYFGAEYNTLYISVDGLLSFEEGMEFYSDIIWQEGTRNDNTDKPFMAPFLYDGFKAVTLAEGTYAGGIYYRVLDEASLDVGNQFYYDDMEVITWLRDYVQESNLNIPDTFASDLVVVVTWDNVLQDDVQTNVVRECASSPSTCKSATFQVILATDKTLKKTIAIFNYDKLNVTMSSPIQAGFNGGHGREWYNVIPCHGYCTDSAYMADLPNLKGSDAKGRFIVDVSDEVILRGGCLPDNFAAGVLEVYPQQVGMFGGEKLEVSAKCLPTSSRIYCRFGEASDSVVVAGKMMNEMKGFCPVPTLTTKGPVRLVWSTEEDMSNPIERTISVVLPSRMESVVDVSDSVKDAWLSRDAEVITIPWDPAKFTTTSGRLDISLIGYREKDNTVEYEVLKNLGSADISDGSYTFRVADHRCQRDCRNYEIGLLEAALPEEYLDIANELVAVRHGEIPLGWYVDEKMTEDNGSDWSNQMCESWHEEDGKQTDWLDALLPCPCNVDQALADFGRFQPDPGCNLFTGSDCQYHIGAKHCVRSIIPTKEGAGNQCCYNSQGNLVYSQLSYQGSTPDRSHSWGTQPYNLPNFVPSLSHWKHDVISFYSCCLWNDYELCDLYMENRPTQDCKYYTPPGIGSVLGVSHVTTFDEQKYQMVAEGDFYLLKTKNVVIQGRFGERRNAWDLGTLAGEEEPFSAPVLTGVGMDIQGALLIDVHLAPENSDRGLDVRVGTERKFFLTESTMWQDFVVVSITNNALPDEKNTHSNFTILTTDNVGVNIVALNGLLDVTVALPPELKRDEDESEGMGLLGTYDNDPDNDFTDSSGVITSPGTSLDKLLTNFVMDWGVKGQRDSAFPYYEQPSQVKEENIYEKYADVPKGFEGSPNEADVNAVCRDSENCKYDYYITGSAAVAGATEESEDLLAYNRASTKLSNNCGLPEVGRNAIMDTYDFFVGSVVTVTGCAEGWSFAGQETYECMKELRAEARENDRGDYGVLKTDPNDNLEYLIHWVPRPAELCTDPNIDSIYIG